MAIVSWSGKPPALPEAAPAAPPFLEARPVRRLARHYRLHAPHGVWTEIRLHRGAGAARFELQGVRFRMEGGPVPGGWLKRARHPTGPCRLVHKDRVLAEAEPDAAGWNLRTAWGESYQLRPAEGGLRLSRDGADVGAILRRPGVRRGAFAQLSPSIPAAVQVFAVWLALSRWEALPPGAG